MKKLTFSVYVLTVAVVLLSSCSRFSDVSLLKRHYRNGYYVETCSAKKSIQRETTLREPIQQLATTPVDKEDQKSNNDFRRVTLKDKSINITKKIESTQSQIKTKEIALYPLIASINKITPVKAIPIETKIVTVKHSDDGGGHALGGLLWLIIVVLLILFLLNFILTLNLGSLVYIILVVALILLLFRLIGML